MMLKFLQPGNWSASQITVSWTLSSRKIIPQVESAIDTAWNTALARPGVHLFDGPMCRLESWTGDESALHLNLSNTSYKPFLGTNMASPHFAAQYGPEVMASPLGVSTAVITTDGQLLLGRRTTAVAYHPGRVHPFAGCMEPRDGDPFTSARRELREELSLEDPEITDLRCTGLIEDQQLHQPELTFAAHASLTRAQIESRLDRVEHHAIWSIPTDPAKIESAAKADAQLTPVAVGTVLLWGRTKWDQRWFESAASGIEHAGRRDVFGDAKAFRSQ